MNSGLLGPPDPTRPNPPATSPTEPGSTTQPPLPDTTTPARRSSKAGIIAGNKSNGRDLTKWRWKPNGCDLPPFDPIRFLETHRDTSVVQGLSVIR